MTGSDAATPDSPAIPARRCLVLAGPRDWAWDRLQAAIETAQQSLLWVAETAPPYIEPISPRQVRRSLGRECAVLVFDTHAGFIVDAFAAAMGTLRGGGVAVVLVPGWQAWAASDPAQARFAPHPLEAKDVGTRFLARLRCLFDAAECVSVETPDQCQSSAWVQTISPTILQASLVDRQQPFELTPEQQQVVAAVQRVAGGHARRPLVLTADRGRGKSTAIGAALGCLLREHHRKQVLVLAPTRGAVDALFASLARELPQGELHEQGFDSESGRVRWRSPDQQLLDPQDCDLLVIDEAAALPLPLLEHFLAQHNRVVFSTTTQGYEGSGRGFALRFRQVLERVLGRMASQSHALTLQQPVRWATDDPLEALLNEALLLNAEAPPGSICDSRFSSGAGSNSSEIDYRRINQDQLFYDPALLRAVFGLLRSAHYQTRPSDLRQLLDAPGLHLLVASQGEQVLGVVLALEEGGLDAELVPQIVAGRRRPHGHMLVQSLAAHAGLSDAPGMRLLRVMRIAVADDLRRQGIGSELLNRARMLAEDLEFDLFGTAFGMDAPLLRFWKRAGLRVLRLGQRRDPASGAHSVQMALGLNKRAEQLVEAGAQRFVGQLPWRLPRTFRYLPADCVAVLLHERAVCDVQLSAADLADVETFAFAHRGLEDAAPSLWRWWIGQLATGLPERSLDRITGDATRITQVVLQNQPLASKAEIKVLREAVATMLESDKSSG